MDFLVLYLSGKEPIKVLNQRRKHLGRLKIETFSLSLRQTLIMEIVKLIITDQTNEILPMLIAALWQTGVSILQFEVQKS